MSRIEKRIREKQRAFLIGMIVGLVLVIVAEAVIDYTTAIKEKNYCEFEGWSECAIEYDGLLDGFNVYYK